MGGEWRESIPVKGDIFIVPKGEAKTLMDTYVASVNSSCFAAKIGHSKSKLLR
jgi:hypothetical protein